MLLFMECDSRAQPGGCLEELHDGGCSRTNRFDRMKHKYQNLKTGTKPTQVCSGMGDRGLSQKYTYSAVCPQSSLRT